MADPIPFDEINLTLTAPEGQEEDVDTMPAYTDGTHCISCWQLSPEDLERLKENGGKVWLWVWSGKTQPPVCVDTVSPFEEQQAEENAAQEAEGHTPQERAVVMNANEDSPFAHKEAEVVLEDVALKVTGVTHIAGAVSDCVQQCARCLEILGDYRNMKVPEGQKPPKAWAEGAYLTIYPGWPTEYVVGEREDAEHCKPLEMDPKQ